MNAASNGASANNNGSRKILYWRAPMNPQYTSDKPGKSPMGMDLVPVYADEANANTIKISPDVIQNIGVTTTEATRGPMYRSIRTYGTTTWAENTMATINTKVGGWVDDLYADHEGEVVKAKEPLLAIYSPALVTTQEEYLRALEYRESLAKSDRTEARRQAEADRQRAAKEAAARKKAETLLHEVRSRKDDPRAFQTVAREKSDDVASRAVGGDLLYLSQAELTRKWSAPMAKAAFALKKVGQISGLVKGAKGYHILRLTGREPPLNRTLGEVKANIEARIRQTDRRQRYEDFVARLRKQAGVKVYDAELQKVDLGSSGVGQPGMIAPHGMPMKAHGMPMHAAPHGMPVKPGHGTPPKGASGH